MSQVQSNMDPFLKLCKLVRNQNENLIQWTHCLGLGITENRSDSKRTNSTVMSHKHPGILNNWQLECLLNRLSMLITTEKPMLHITGSLWGESTRILVDSPHKGPVLWKTFPCHDFYKKPHISAWRAINDMFVVSILQTTDPATKTLL